MAENIHIGPMTDDEATPLHWLVLECLECLLFNEQIIDDVPSDLT